MFKVFLVEDEIVVREGIRNNILWEQYGFQYAGDAPDGELALPLIRQIKPDLLITDIKMPFMDGLALIELVRKEFPDMKIVIISGYDDFSYAQQAIRLGVDQYLLKPIAKAKIVEILAALQKKMEEEQKQQEYLAKVRREAQEYESYSRRKFFEQIVSGGLSVLEISETAKAMGIDVNAPYYNIVLFSLKGANYDASTAEGSTDVTDKVLAIHNRIRQFIHSHPELILFRWSASKYAILVKGEQNDIVQRTVDCIESIKGYCSMGGSDVSWHIAHGTPVSRLGALPNCFSEASRALSYHYLCSEERIRDFLSKSESKDVDRFIDKLLQSAGEDAVSPTLFCRYLTMTVYFAAVKYLDSIGCRVDSFWPLEFWPDDGLSTPEKARDYMCQVIGQAMELRDHESKRHQCNMLAKAIRFIDEHYSEESISLDRVAKTANVSPNYFSTVFSQEVGQTFIEYLTNKRIDEAKRMLKHTKMRSSEIATAIGYKDPHYFSYVFKKVSGLTPNEFRRGCKK